MRKTVITYACDGCGKAQKVIKDLRSFSIVHRKRGRALDDYCHADLCAECEARLIAAVEPIMGSDVLELQREPAPTRTKTAKTRSVTASVPDRSNESENT